MADGNGVDGWDAFDWNGLDDGDHDGTPADSANGHTAPSQDQAPATPEGQTSEGHWIRSGGILRWEEGDEGSGERVTLRSEAASHWADDDLDLPLGAPPRVRLRAMRAWLARRQELEQEAQGMVLLERRRLREEGGEPEPARGIEHHPLSLALAEHQAAAAEYERLLEALAELESHSGLDRVLIEFYLCITESLAVLALAPEAPADFRAAALVAEPESPRQQPVPTPLSRAEWHGRAEAVLGARRRAERVTTPEEGE
jgi:hypothetical protein